MVEISANDLVDLIREVENDIKAVVAEICAKFTIETGFAINDVWLKFDNVTTAESIHPEYSLTSVSCDIALRE